MSIRVTVWNEFRHEKDKSHVASEIYPNGIHTPIAEYLRGKGLAVDHVQCNRGEEKQAMSRKSF